MGVVSVLESVRERDPVTDTSSLVSGVAQRYASALFDLAIEADSLEATEKDLDRFDALISESEDLKRLVQSPVFSAEEQEAAVSAVLDKAGISGLVGNFVKLAASNRRLMAIQDMAKAFRQLAAKHRGEVTADVTSAEPLTDQHAKALKKALKAAVGKDVKLNASVDPSLIGGLIVKVGSRMIDTSLRTKLNSLKIRMKEVG